MEEQLLSTVTPVLIIEGVDYYTIDDLAFALKVPVRNFIAAIRRGEFGGRKIGTVYLVTGPTFRAWIESGRLVFKTRDYTNRKKKG